MGANGLDVFDRTPRTTDIGLDEPMQDEAGGHDPRIAWQRRLPVVNRDKRLVGISALGDLAVVGSPRR
jgi:hypothetical protein